MIRARQVLLGLLLACAAVGVADPAEFRSRIPIATLEPLPDGARYLDRPVPVDRAAVEEAVRRLYAAYGFNPADLGPILGEDFVDKTRLLETVSERLPRDARLTVLAVRSYQTLNQILRTDPADGREIVVSSVAAVVHGQLEFNDPVAGFQRLENVSELILRIRQPRT